MFLLILLENLTTYSEFYFTDQGQGSVGLFRSNNLKTLQLSKSKCKNSNDYLKFLGFYGRL